MKDEHCYSRLTVLLTALVLLGIGVYVLNTSTTATVSPPAAVLEHASKSTVTSAVQVYTPSTKKALNLPKTVQADSSQVVLTATDIPKSKTERTVSTVLNLETGEAVQYIQDKPLPLLGTASSGSVGMYAGLKNLEPAVRLQATQDLFTVKAGTFGAIAAVDVTTTGRTDTFIGVGARLDW